MPAWIKVAIAYTSRSLLEFGFLALFGLMPVWLGAIYHAVENQNPVLYLSSYLTDGEALLLSAAIIGPLLYMVIASDFGSKKHRGHFPLKGWFSLAIIAICVVSAGLVGFQSAEATAATLSTDALYKISWVISCASVIVWFAIVGTNAVRENGAARIMRQDEHDFVESFGK